MNLERERERERDLEGMKTSSEVASLAFTDIFAFFVVIVAINSGWPWRRRRFQNWLGVITVVTVVVVVVVAIWFFLLYYQLHFQLLLFKSPSFLSLSLSPPRLKPRKKQVKKQKNVVHCSLSYFFFFFGLGEWDSLIYFSLTGMEVSDPTRSLLLNEQKFHSK